MQRLIDSSLWVDFTRRKSPAALREQIHPWILDAGAVVCEPVMFEVLRHATSTERPMIVAQFNTLPVLHTPSDLWNQAAKVGQQCRDHGFTAGSLDLVIAAVALHHDAELITFDADYIEIGRACPLRVQLLKRSTS